MPFDVVLHIPEDGHRGRAIQQMVDTQHVTAEQVIEQIIDAGIQAQLSDPDNYDHLFTPEVAADLRGIAADMETGGLVYSSEQVREHFVQKRKAWLANHQD
jgi:hypothetical protein